MSADNPHAPIPAHYSREPDFETALQRIAANSGRHHDLDLMVEWALTRAPKRFLCVGGDFYLWKTGKMEDGFPALRVLYRYLESEHTVIAQTISIANEDEDEGPIRWTPPDPDAIDF